MEKMSMKLTASAGSSSNFDSNSFFQEKFVEETCQYQNRKCYQPVVESYKYCLRHILEDSNAPYKQCNYVYPNLNQKCPNAVPKGDKGFCQMHLWKILLRRQKSTAKNVPPLTTESLLSELSHYVRPVRTNKTEINEKTESYNVTHALNPFVEVDVSKASLRRAQVLEYASESDSDTETATLDTVWRGTNEESSDAESIDSQIDDPLRHAGVFTAEEVVMLARNKMLRLQMLYQRQFEKLTHTLKEKRRTYLQATKREKEFLGPIHKLPRKTAKEHKMHEKLKALNRYHRRSNKETLAYLASLEKRAKESGVSKAPSTATSNKCVYTEGGVRCPNQVLPLTKYCFKHILQDPNQCMFRACGCAKLDIVCQEPLVELSSGDSCILHLRLPTLPHVSLNSQSASERDREVNTKTIELESELDASATESAISTDNRDSPDDVEPPCTLPSNEQENTPSEEPSHQTTDNLQSL